MAKRYHEQGSDEEFFTDRRKKSRPPKHSKNLRGFGMKVLNSYVEEEDGNVLDDQYDYDETMNHTSFTSSKHLA